MKNKELLAIFDMDGTFYQFDKGSVQNFDASRFRTDMLNNVQAFFKKRVVVTDEDARQEYERIRIKFKGEISLGVETEYGIDRYEFFAETWGPLKPTDYIDADENLPTIMNPHKGRIALLTSAPRVWAEKVLTHLKIRDVFEEAIYTGEPDLRKPNPEVFRKIADDFNKEPIKVFSVGDQEETDILPAQLIGMKTVRIGLGPTQADYQAVDIFAAISLLEKEGIL